jgi:hypothetical protein
VDGLVAAGFQPLSCAHSGSRQENWLDDQPNEASIDLAIDCGVPDAAGVAGPDAVRSAVSVARCSAATRKRATASLASWTMGC